MTKKQNQLKTQALIVEPVTQPDPKYERAFTLQMEIIQRRAEIARNFLELGRLFKAIRDEGLHKLLDHNTFKSFLASVGFREKTVYGYIHVYELYIERLKISPGFLIQVPYRALLRINPVVEMNPDDWLYKAKELSESDLIAEVALAQGKPEPQYITVEPEKPKPFDSENYEKFIRAYGCIICPDKKDVEGAHFPQTKKRGAPDHWKIPLCHDCHQLYHRDPIDFLITYRNQIFGFFYTVMLSCYNLLEGEKK